MSVWVSRGAIKACARVSLRVLFALGVVNGGGRCLLAAITTGGNVTPAPPAAGGNVAAPFLVGDTAVGTLSISGGTPLNVTGGSATVGDHATAIGVVALTGLGSTLNTANDLIIGNVGTGFVSVASFATMTFADDLLMGVSDGSAGTLSMTNLGTIVDVVDTVSVGNGGTGVIEVVNGARMLADDTLIGVGVTGEGRVSLRDLHT